MIRTSVLVDISSNGRLTLNIVGKICELYWVNRCWKCDKLIRNEENSQWITEVWDMGVRRGRRWNSDGGEGRLVHPANLRLYFKNSSYSRFFGSKQLLLGLIIMPDTLNSSFDAAMIVGGQWHRNLMTISQAICIHITMCPFLSNFKYYFWAEQCQDYSFLNISTPKITDSR